MVMETNIITLTANTYARATLLKTRLEDEGIECFLSNVNLVQPGISFGVRIKIFEKDMERALKIVRNIEAKHGKDLVRGKKDIHKISRILVPVDFSDYSLNASIFAIMLAEKLGAEVRLFHSYYNPMIDTMSFPDGYTYQTNMAEIFKDLSTIAKKNMRQFMEKLNMHIKEKKLQNIKISRKLVAGTPAEEIITETEKFKPGVIIIGTRGTGENPNEPIGNVTSSVLNNSEIPVLVIPENSSFSSIGEKINILYTTEFDETDSEAIKKLMAVISPFQFSIYCAHVTPNVKNSLIIAKMKDLRAELKEMYHNLHLECELVKDTDVIEGVKKLVAKKNIDVIALTHYKRNIFYRILNPSLAKRMIFRSEKPVLIFHG